MRDIDTTVNFMRDLLKHESTTRSDASSPAYGAAPSAAQSKDAVGYKHDDTRSGSTYKPSSRHLDRKSVRYAGEESGAEIGDLRRQLQNTSALLDKSNADYERKSDEDERLEQEVDDLKYRVKRLQEDIDYVSKGRRSAEKDEERRKLEREVLFLMHEKLPELERRQQQREDEKKMEERAGVRARDRRNDTHGRYDDRDRESKDDHAWLRGSYDRERRDSRDRSRDRDQYRRDERDRDFERRDSRDRDYRPRSPPASRTPPPAPSPAAAAAAAAPPPVAPPKPTSAAAVPNTKNMTPEERTAFIREQAQRRIQDRLRALGVESAPSPDTPVVDKSVEERLAQEKKEAEERSKTADEEQKAREAARQARLNGGNPIKDETPKSPEPKSILKGNKAAPPPPVSRGKQPPKPPAPRSTPSVPSAPPVLAAAAAPAQAEEDDEDAEFRRREEAIKKAKEDRRRRLADLEREEEEERKREDEAASSARKPRSQVSETAATQAAPPAPPAPPAPVVSGSGGYNPFRKPGAASTPSAAPASTSGGGFNPFFKPQAAKSPSPAATPVTSPPPAPAPPPAPPAPIAPPAPPAPAPPAPAPAAADDGWESIHEKEADSDDDSSDDDDYAKSRDNRRNLASALFGGLTGGGSNSPTTSRPGSAAPKAPVALKNIGGGDPGAGMGALLSAIQGGARLKKAQTVVKGATVSGKVIGEAAPPAHISDTPREYASVPDESESPVFQPRSENRQSVDWYSGLAADESHPAQAQMEALSLETTREEPEPVQAEADPKLSGNAEEDELADFDLTQSELCFVSIISFS